MALLPDLASSSDLSARGANVSNAALVAVMLAVASSTVRQAAQSPILETESDVTLWATDEDRYLDLPGKPVTAVDTVVLDGDALDADDYKLVNGRLWRLGGWGYRCEPIEVTATVTHGFAAVPPHIKQIVCDLAIAGMAAASAGAHDPRVLVESIDDYSVTFAQGGEAVATAMELPRATKQAIRKQFGGGAAMVVAS